MRAPWIGTGEFRHGRLPPLAASGGGLAGLLGPLRLGREPDPSRGPLQVADLLLQRVNLRCCWSGCGAAASSAGGNAVAVPLEASA